MTGINSEENIRKIPIEDFINMSAVYSFIKMS